MTNTCAEFRFNRCTTKTRENRGHARGRTATTAPSAKTVHEWGHEKFLAEVGRDRAEAWIQSDKVKSIPDPVTGSTEPEIRAFCAESP